MAVRLEEAGVSPRGWGISTSLKGGKCLGQGLANFVQGLLLQEGISREDEKDTPLKSSPTCHRAREWIQKKEGEKQLRGSMSAQM